MANRIFPADAVGGVPSYSGRALRQSLLAPLLGGATAARPLGAISGVRPGTPDTTVTATSTVWTVKPHAGVLDVETAVEAGPYGYAIDANVTGAVTAAHATYTRWDGIYIQLSDPAEADGTAAPGVAVVYVAGTPAAAPAMPAQPARSILLARIVVPKSGSGSPSVVWLAPVLALAGGVRHYNSVGDLPGLAASDSGMVAVIGTGADYAEYVWDGSAWQQQRGMGWAWVESQLSAAFTPGGTFTDLGMPIGRQNPGTGSVWEVTVNLDAEVAVSAASTFEAQLVAAGARVGEIVAGCAAGMVGLRMPLTRTWRVSGMPSAWVVFEVQVKATGAGVWRLYPVHSHMLVRQVA